MGNGWHCLSSQTSESPAGTRASQGLCLGLPASPVTQVLGNHPLQQGPQGVSASAIISLGSQAFCTCPFTAQTQLVLRKTPPSHKSPTAQCPEDLSSALGLQVPRISASEAAGAGPIPPPPSTVPKSNLPLHLVLLFPSAHASVLPRASSSQLDARPACFQL